MATATIGTNSTSGHCAVVLHDAIPASAPADEQDGVAQAGVVAAALQRLGYAVASVPFDENLTALRRRLVALDPDIVVNLVESRAGHGHLIHFAPALLEDLALPFTGTPQPGVFLTSHKLLAKRWLMRHDCPTPPTVDDPARPENGPWIMKSVWEDASFGLDDESVIANPSALAAQLDRRRAGFGGDWFAESYVPGREFNVSLLECDEGCRVLPIAEICFEDYAPDVPRIVGYRAKWAGDSFEYAHTTRRFDSCNAALREDMSALALRCWEIFELRGYARVDLRIDDAGRPWILEVNVNPCLAPDAGFAASLEQASIAFDDAILAIVAAATREKGTFQFSRASNPASGGHVKGKSGMSP